MVSCVYCECLSHCDRGSKSNVEIFSCDVKSALILRVCSGHETQSYDFSYLERSVTSYISVYFFTNQVMEVDKKADSRDNDQKKVESKVLRKFTWKELSQLNGRHNAHVAVRGKV